MTPSVLLVIPNDCFCHPERGTWCGPVRCESGRLSAYVRCPNCGHFISLASLTILPNGTVREPVACPWPECGAEPWRQYLQLKDWAVSIETLQEAVHA